MKQIVILQQLQLRKKRYIQQFGYLPFINSGDYLKVKGKFVTHQEYGRQFKIEYFEKKLPESKEALEKYLANGIIKGVGPATARRIVEKFGNDTLEVFKFYPKKLAEVKGISEDRAEEIAAEFNEKWGLWQIVEFLEKFGIGPSNSKKIYDALGVNAVEKFEDLPENAKKYVAKIEELVGVSVDMVSVGPNRAQTIVRKNIF